MRAKKRARVSLKQKPKRCPHRIGEFAANGMQRRNYFWDSAFCIGIAKKNHKKTSSEGWPLRGGFLCPAREGERIGRGRVAPETKSEGKRA
jgi:hypothetical protein